jgi:hypothetical protein
VIVTVQHIERDIDVDTFTDITPTTVEDVRWNDAGGLDITFASDLTTDERILVKIRCLSSDDAEEQELRQAWTAYKNNLDYLAITNPTNAQALAQIAALTRQVNGIIRHLVQDF